MGKATCVICDGPFPDIDSDGEEIPTWSVYPADDEGDEAGAVWKCYTYAAALAYAASLAKTRRLELVMEAQRA